MSEKKRMEGYRNSRSVKAMQGQRSLMKLWSTVSSFEDEDVRCPALRLMLMYEWKKRYIVIHC